MSWAGIVALIGALAIALAGPAAAHPAGRGGYGPHGHSVAHHAAKPHKRPHRHAPHPAKAAHPKSHIKSNLKAAKPAKHATQPAKHAVKAAKKPAKHAATRAPVAPKNPKKAKKAKHPAVKPGKAAPKPAANSPASPGSGRPATPPASRPGASPTQQGAAGVTTAASSFTLLTAAGPVTTGPANIGGLAPVIGGSTSQQAQHQARPRHAPSQPSARQPVGNRQPPRQHIASPIETPLQFGGLFWLLAAIGVLTLLAMGYLYRSGRRPDSA